MAHGQPRDFIFDAAIGKKGGYEVVVVLGEKFGQNIADGVQTIWDMSTTITFLSATTELFISSTNAGDTAVSVVVSGVDSSFNTVDLLVTTNGQTAVSIGNYFRVNRAVVVSATEPVGDLYIASTGTLTGGVPDDLTTVQSRILAGKNVTHNGFYTVPIGKAAIVMAIRGSSDSINKTTTVMTCQDLPGTIPFLNTSNFSFSAGLQEYTFPAPVGATNVAGQLSVPSDQGATLEFRSSVDANDTNTFFGIDFLLIPRSEVGIAGL